MIPKNLTTGFIDAIYIFVPLEIQYKFFHLFYFSEKGGGGVNLSRNSEMKNLNKRCNTRYIFIINFERISVKGLHQDLL